MTITVLHLLHKLTFGGTERVIVNLLNHSTRRSKNYICSFCHPDMDFLQELRGSERVVFSLDKKEGNDFSVPFKIANFCRERRVDIVHALGWGTYIEGLIAAKLSGKIRKFVFSFRGKTIEDTIGIPRRRILAQRFLSVFCDAILTPSEVSRNEYSREMRIDPRKIQVIYNGVDLKRFRPSPGECLEEKRKAFGLQMDDIVIGSVTRFDPVKNIDALVRAFARLNRNVSKRSKLLLIGDGSELSAVRKLTDDLGLTEKVIFAGMRQDVPICLGLMDIYIQPSLFEGVPNAVLEAMAAGLPIVATNVGGVSEIVEDGKTGFLVDPNSEDGLTHAMDILIQHKEKRRQMGQSGRTRVVSLFSIEKMVSDYENLYEQLMQKGL